MLQKTFQTKSYDSVGNNENIKHLFTTLVLSTPLKFISKVDQTFCHFWVILKILLLKLETAVTTVGKLAYVLFQYLVTLLVTNVVQ